MSEGIINVLTETTGVGTTSTRKKLVGFKQRYQHMQLCIILNVHEIKNHEKTDCYLSYWVRGL